MFHFGAMSADDERTEDAEFRQAEPDLQQAGNGLPLASDSRDFRRNSLRDA
jgi:hypothetical protein